MGISLGPSTVMDITTPLPPDEGQLLFHSLRAKEALGRLFEYQISVLATANSIDPNKLLGQAVTVGMELPANIDHPSAARRHFNGYVTRFGLAGVEGRYYRYEMVVRPWLWLLTRTSDCRIFQDKTVPVIIKEIFGEYGIAVFKDDLKGDYRKWEYCVQYRETDFNFVSRLMETEGIYYYFTHEAGKHTLVLADGMGAHQAFGGYATIPFIAHDQAARLEREYFSSWAFSDAVQPGKLVLKDFDFKKPSTFLMSSSSNPRRHDQANHEFFDYPGAFTEFSDGDQYARTRFDELQCQFGRATGSGNARGLTTGYLFTLSGHPREDQNIEYLVVSTEHWLSYDGYEAGGGGGTDYRCSCTVLSTKEFFRPARETPKAHVAGPQTAIVVGPSGDEIYTDKFGRVKVQFHWDRYGNKNENSSCWIRVSHPWAGKNWGMIAIPRIGQEVVVDFLEGDPDQPLITGRVYNADQMPPYDLPANKTQTGIKTRSTLKGSPDNHNEIRFEDKIGSEHLLIHAEKDQMIEVENDETHTVGHDRKKTIGHDETTEVKNDRTEKVGNNEKITIGVDRTEEVGGNEKIDIKGNRTEKVVGAEDITITGGRTEKVTGDEKITITGSRNETVTGTETINITGSQSSTVTGGITVTTPASMSVTATAGLNVTAPAGVNVTAAAGVNLLGGTQINGMTSKSSWTTWNDSKLAFFAFKHTLISIDTKTINIGYSLIKSDNIILKNKSEALTKHISAVALKNHAVKLGSGALDLAKKALHIKT